MGKLDDKAVEAAVKKLGLKVEGKGAEAGAEALREHFKKNGNSTEGDPKELMECGNCLEPSFAELTSCPFCGTNVGAGGDAPPVPSAVAGAKPAAPESSKAIVAKDDLKASSEVQTVAKLDESVDEVRRLKGDSAASYWELGRKVCEIFDTKLWQLRLDDKGKARWKSFDAFCHHELGFEPRMAYKLMDGSRNFTREQAVAIGRKKLQLIAAAPQEDQPALVEKAAEGASVRQITSEIQKIKKEKDHTRPARGADEDGHTGKVRGQGGGRPKKDKPGTPSPVEKITVASAPGKTVVKLFAGEKMTPKQKKGDMVEAPPAKRLADGPIGREELSNGVVAVYTVREGRTGQLELHITRERVG